jgi:Retrotransposon gag protein
MSDNGGANLTQHLIAGNSTLNRKIDDLTKNISKLSIGEDVKEYLEEKIAAIRDEGGYDRRKVKSKLDKFDPKKHKLRSWMTAANNFLYTERVTSEEDKVRTIGGYLSGLAWEWFEPILHEADESKRDNWSARTKRIMRSYTEFGKALKQVFGQIDERKDAAAKMTRLRQHTSVTMYVTEFQTIASSLEWDDEALEDKFLEGLKPEIREALIYYTEEPDNLEELYERAQRIDREKWNARSFRNQRHSNFHGSSKSGRGGYNYRAPIRLDADGDIRMTGAKVDLQKAKEQRLCFSCGKPGHQARFCRKKRQDNTREGFRKNFESTPKIGMLRMNPLMNNPLDSSSDESDDIVNPFIQEMETAVYETLRAPTPPVEGERRPVKIGSPWGQSDLDEQKGETREALEQRIDKWNQEAAGTAKGITRNRDTQGIKEGIESWTPLKGKQRFTNEGVLTGEQPMIEPKVSMARTTVEDMPHEERGKTSPPVTAQSTTDSEEDLEDALRKTISRIEYGATTLTNNNLWLKNCGTRTENPRARTDEQKIVTRACRCFSFYQKCWATTKDPWEKHVKSCSLCTRWLERKCALKGHDQLTRNSLMIDLGRRRHVIGLPIKDNCGRTCCERNVCTHEFFTHKEANIPWWACLDEGCRDHYDAKRKNGFQMELPTCTILNAQLCPCMRKGCVCGFGIDHPFHNMMTAMGENKGIFENLEEIEELVKRIKTEHKPTAIRIRQLTSSTEAMTVKQLSTPVKIGKRTVTAIVDSGADVSYINWKWCLEQNIPIRQKGFGLIRSYDGLEKRVKVMETRLSMKIKGKFMRHTVKVLEDTGEDVLVLGMPWLEETNPFINWRTREIQFRKTDNKETNEEWIPAVNLKKIELTEKTDKEKEYDEIMEKLPEPVKEFTNLFCKTK